VIASAAASDTTSDAVTEVDCTEEEEAAGVATTGHNCRKHKKNESEDEDEDEDGDDEEDSKSEEDKPLKVPIPMAEIHDPWRLKPIHSFFKCADLLEPRLVTRCQECFKHNVPAPWEVIGFQANNKQCRVGHTIDRSMPDPPVVRFAQINLETNQIEQLSDESEAEAETEADEAMEEETADELELEDADEEADEADEESDIEDAEDVDEETDEEADEEADEESDEETDEEADEEAEEESDEEADEESDEEADDEEEAADEEDESDAEVTEFLELASQELSERLHAFRTAAQKHL